MSELNQALAEAENYITKAERTLEIQLEGTLSNKHRKKIDELYTIVCDAGTQVARAIGAAKHHPAQAIALPAPIGTELGGGLYVGPHFEDGRIVHLVAAPDTLPAQSWSAAHGSASQYRAGGFDDWRLPTKNELMSALMHAQGLFKKALHWTATPYGSDYAWVVDFEDGDVLIYTRDNGFRVRPFRRHHFSPSSLSPAETVALGQDTSLEVDRGNSLIVVVSNNALDAKQELLSAVSILDLLTTDDGFSGFEELDGERQSAILHNLLETTHRGLCAVEHIKLSVDGADAEEAGHE